jgi:CRISPR-associated endonuclease Csn1
MKKLGLDMGSSSLGWVITENGKIVKKGVVTFDTGMVKDQSGGYVSPTRERREVRSKRNLIRARKYGVNIKKAKHVNSLKMNSFYNGLPATLLMMKA